MVTQKPMRMSTGLIAASLVLVVALGYWLWTPDLDRARLEARYVETPADLIQVADWRLHVRDRGPRDAPAIVLIHGFGASLQTWDRWAGDLARDHRVIRFDLPGSGLSAPDPADVYTDARSIDLLRALMDQLGLRRAVIVGHSIGGRIAWRYAALYPERVERLVLVAPDGYASPGFAYGVAPSVPKVLDLMQVSLPRPLLRSNLRPAYADPAFLTDALVDRYRDLLRAPGGRRALLDRMRQTVLEDPRTALRSIRAPTLLLWGQRDAMIPPANAADYQREIAGAQLVTFANCGHLPQEEAAAESLAALRKFLGP